MVNESKLSALNVATLYETIIPSTKKRVQYRAYNVREERALLTADESEDGKVMISTLNRVVLNCLYPVQESLTQFDLEYLFAQIRSKSVGEIAVVKVGCDNEGCEDVSIEYRYDLNQLQVVYPSNASEIIKLSNDIAVKMKYPSVEEAVAIESIESDIDRKYKAIVQSIAMIYHGEEIIDVKDERKEDILKFVDELNPQQYRKLEQFFEEIPYVEGELKYRCTKCKKDHQKKIRGLSNFF